MSRYNGTPFIGNRSVDPWTGLAWSREGVSLPDCSGRNLLIIADGTSAPNDLAKLGSWTGDVMALNISGLLYWDHIDHWVTPHPSIYFTAREWRRIRWNDWGFLCHTHWLAHELAHPELADVCWQFVSTDERGPYEHQNAGVLALAVAKGLGYGRGDNIIVTVGLEFTGDGHYYDLTLAPVGGVFERYRPLVQMMIDEGRLNNVYAVSGWLTEVLGTPPEAARGRE